MFVKKFGAKKYVPWLICAILASLVLYLGLLVFTDINAKDKTPQAFVESDVNQYIVYESENAEPEKGFFENLFAVVGGVFGIGEEPEPTPFSEESATETPNTALDLETALADGTFVPTFANVRQLTSMRQLHKALYSVDQTAYITIDDLNMDTLASMDLTSQLSTKEPKILIFHTHSQEDFIDSREGEEADTIVGVGQTLAETLVNDYHISVVHDKGRYDTIKGRGDSYAVMEPYIRGILEKYPSIEVCIDLHRDGVNDDMHLMTEIDGLPRARIMFFNGITRLNEDGIPQQLTDLPNPYLQENLALSLQMHLKTNELYPGLTRKIYVRPYRYSLHMKPKSLLVEAGANTNTVQEVKNSMPLLAEVLNAVLNES